MADHGFTARQRAFIQAYLRTGNATKAAIEAGYKSTHANVVSSHLLTKVDIREAIEKGRAETSAKLQLTRETMLERYRQIADAKGQEDVKVAVKLHAMDSISKILGLFSEEKAQTNSSFSLVIQTPITLTEEERREAERVRLAKDNVQAPAGQ